MNSQRFHVKIDLKLHAVSLFVHMYCIRGVPLLILSLSRLPVRVYGYAVMAT